MFARHVEVQQAVLERFPTRCTCSASDSIAAREDAIDAFQSPTARS